MHLMVLLVRRGNRSYQLPADDLVLCPEDRLLLAGSPLAKRHVKLTLDNPDRLNYVLTGQETRGGAIWRWLTRKHPPKVVPLSPQDMLPPRQEDAESVDTNHDFNTFDYRG